MGVLLPIFRRVYLQDKEEGEKLMRAWLVLSQFLVLGVSLVCFLFMPEIASFLYRDLDVAGLEMVVNMSRILLLSPIIFTISNTVGVVLHSFKHYLAFALSASFYNVGIILGLLLFAEKHGVYSVVIGTGIGLGMHLIIRLIDFVFIDGFKFRLNFWHPEIWKVLRLSLPKMASLFTLQLTLLVYNVVGVGLVDGSISAFNYARNVQGFAVSMFGVALATAVFPFLVDLKASGDMQKVRLKIEDSILRILIFTLPASVGLFLLSKDTVNTLFNRGAFDENDLYMTMVVLGVFAVSISFESLNHLLIRIYNAFENTILPLLAGILFIGVNVGLVFGFAEEYGVVVFGLAYGLGFVVQVLVLFLLLRKYVKLEWGRVFKDVGRMLVAVFLMGVVVRYGRDLFGGEFLSLIEYVGLIGLGGMVYMIGIWFLGVFRYTGFEHHIKKIIGNG
jgi:putative peptidoglycan lipid II flippase